MSRKPSDLRRLCEREDCGGVHHAHGLCIKHYAAARQRGVVFPKGPRKMAPPVPRTEYLAKRYRADLSGCWVWLGKLMDGYGRAVYNGERHPAHRFAYETLVGPIPDGLQIDHLCRNRACVNPDHLEPVTLAENIRRSDPYRDRSYQTWPLCPRGHVKDMVTYNGQVRCRECARANCQGRRDRLAAAAVIVAGGLRP